MRCKDCEALHKVDDGRYMCWGVREPFTVENIDQVCPEYPSDEFKSSNGKKRKTAVNSVDPVTRTVISEFISEFNDSTGAVKEFFMAGKCYWFAVILSERFKYLHPEIAYDPIDGHFLTKIKGRFYDASGDVTEEHKGKAFLWDKLDDPDWKSRITKDCIDLVSW